MDPVLPTPPTSPPAAPQSVVSPPNSPTKIWVWIAAGVVLLGTGIVTGVLLSKQLYSKPALQPTPSPVAESTPTPLPAEASAPADDLYREPTGSAATTNWKTYSNNVYRFSLKYPSEWKYLEVPNNTYETKNNQIWFTHSDFPPPNTGARADIVFVVTSFDPSADWEPKYFDNYRSIAYQLGNITAKKITGINKEGLNQEFVIIARIGNYYLQVMPNQSEESLKYLDQILSTFHFLK